MSLQLSFNKSALKKVFRQAVLIGLSCTALNSFAHDASADHTTDHGADNSSNFTQMLDPSSQPPPTHQGFIKDIITPWEQSIDTKVSDQSHKRDHSYKLHRDISFDDYDQDQQRSVLNDYAGRFLDKSHTSTHMKAKYGADNCYAGNVLKEIVEAKFPQAKEIRLSMPDRRTEGLTANEAAFIHNIFGDDIDTSVIQKHMEIITCHKIVAQTDRDNNIKFYSEKFHSEDYALEENNYNFGTFIHEATHVWQAQTDDKFTDGLARKTGNTTVYKYIPDTEEMAFTDFNNEQQGAIIEDYARYFLHIGKETAQLKQNTINITELRKTVEEQFPNAKIMREYYEENGKLPTHKINAGLNAGPSLQNKTPSA